MWKLVTLETQSVRFHPNGSSYADPHNPCLSATTVFDCADSWGENGGGGRQSCHVCTPEAPCLFDVIADPGETTNVAKTNQDLVAELAAELATFKPYVLTMTLTPDNLACYNCSFSAAQKWHNYTGPGCIAKAS